MYWEILPKITTAISFAAFVLAILAYILKNNSKRKQSIISKLPETDRLSALKALADNLGISAKEIRNEELIFKLVMERLKSQSNLRRTIYYLVFIIFLVSTALVVFQIASENLKNNQTNSILSNNVSDSLSNDSSLSEISNSTNDKTNRQGTKRNGKTSSNLKADPVLAKNSSDNNPVYKNESSTKDKYNPPSTSQPLQSKRIKIFYTDATKESCELLKINLDKEGAFTDTEKVLIDQMPANSIIFFKPHRKDLAEYISDNNVLEIRFQMSVLSSTSSHDLEIFIKP